MGKKTPVYKYHLKHGHIVEYAGYDLPVWYQGIIQETKNVREHAGIFDVSHMGRVFMEGPDASRFLDHVTTNDVSSLGSYKGQYSLFCNPNGGIIDDLTVFRLEDDRYLLVYNAANREKNWSWLQRNLAHHERVKLDDVSDNVAMFAVQGPRSRDVLRLIGEGLDLEEIDRYSAVEAKIDDIRCLVTRTGYTGEDGFEIYIHTRTDDQNNGLHVWEKILNRGRTFGLGPVGLGARDVLRLEAGMCLYGNDIDEQTTPVEARLMFVTRLEKKDFVGKKPIMEEREKGARQVRVGFRMLGRGIPRKGQVIYSHGATAGVVTSGTLSPTLGDSIGMGLVKPEYTGINQELLVRVRDRDVPAVIVKLPFYQRRSPDRVMVYGHEMGLGEFRKPKSATQSNVSP